MSPTSLIHPNGITITLAPETETKRAYLMTELRQRDDWKTSSQRPINDDDTPTKEINPDSKIMSNSDRINSTNPSNNTNSPNESFDSISAKLVNKVHCENFQRPINNDDTPSEKINPDSTTADNDDSTTADNIDRLNSTNTIDNATSPIESYDSISPKLVHDVHHKNFSHLVHLVLKAEEAVTNSGLSLSSPSSPEKFEKKNPAQLLSSPSRKRNSRTPSRKRNPRNCKNSDNDNAILREETALFKFRKKLRSLTVKYAQGIAQALSLFERAVHKNESEEHSKPVYRLVIDPIQRREEMQLVLRQHEQQQQQQQQQQQPIRMENRKPPEEYHHTHQPDVITILTLARSLINFWRHSLQPNDRVLAPDYVDEYEPNDERIGWVKLFNAVVTDVVWYRHNGRVSQVGLGDSSTEMKRMYVLSEGEMAVRLHYLQYPPSQDQWVLLADDRHVEIDTENLEVLKGMHIFPMGSHHESLLSMNISDDDDDIGDSNSVTESEAKNSNCGSFRGGKTGKKRSRATDNKELTDNGYKPKRRYSDKEDKTLVREIICEIRKTVEDKITPEKMVRLAKSYDLKPNFWSDLMRKFHPSRNEKSLMKRLAALRLHMENGNVLSTMLMEDMKVHARCGDASISLMEDMKLHARSGDASVSLMEDVKLHARSGDTSVSMGEEKSEDHVTLPKSISQTNNNGLESSKRKRKGNGSILEYLTERGKPQSPRIKTQYPRKAMESLQKETESPLKEMKIDAKHSSMINDSGGADELVPTKKKSTRNNQMEERKLSMTWICTECCEAECITQPESPLIICEGVCARPFHYPCAGLASLPPSNEKWVCRDCLDRRHECFVCQKYGNDEEEVYMCAVKSCGLFYHEACLNAYDVDVELSYDTVSIPVSSDVSIEQDRLVGVDSSRDPIDPNKTYEEKVVSRPKFRCPAHHCWTCSGGIPPDSLQPSESDLDLNATLVFKKKKKKGISNSFQQKKEMLFRCLYCPNSYHLSCIPPISRFHELALICHEHAYTRKLPYLDVSSSFQAKIEADDEEFKKKLHRNDKKVPTRSKPQAPPKFNGTVNPFLQGMRGDHLPLFHKEITQVLSTSENGQGKMNNLQSFCLPCDVQNEVHSKPPAYAHIHTNRYIPNNRPKRHPPSAACQCMFGKDDSANACDEHCLNRMVGTECIGDRDSKLGEKDPYWNCNCGPDCGNRMLGRRDFAKCKPKHEQGRGWGLSIVNGIKKGGLVQEYVGEIIDAKTKKERLDVWAREHPNDPNFYIMHLESGWYIDARVKGSLSRFINHSCEPNCKLAPLNVAGHTRVSIVSTRNIAPGEFLSYDYQFDTKDSDKFVCRCGSSQCRGTMKGGSNSTNAEGIEDKKKTKRDLWLEAKARYERDKIFLLEFANSSKARLNQVNSSFPGDKKNTLNTIANGPQPSLATKSRTMRVCLWRNVIRGSDFSSRHWKLLESAQGKKSVQNLKRRTSKQKLPSIDVLSIIKKMSITKIKTDGSGKN